MLTTHNIHVDWGKCPMVSTGCPGKCLMDLPDPQPAEGRMPRMTEHQVASLLAQRSAPPGSDSPDLHAWTLQLARDIESALTLRPLRQRCGVGMGGTGGR